MLIFRRDCRTINAPPQMGLGRDCRTTNASPQMEMERLTEMEILGVTITEDFRASAQACLRGEPKNVY